MYNNELIEQFDYNLHQISCWLQQQNNSRFSTFFDFSKKYLYQKTWTLVIGTKHSGKTTFLRQADLSIVQDSEDDSMEYSTWFNQEGIFIELPSIALNHSEENATIQHFLHALKARRRKKPFDNILLTINVHSFTDAYEAYTQYLNALQEQLQKILSPYLLQETPIYIVFTHMDKVAGFCDFFSEFSAQHATNILGYLMDEYSSKKKLMDQHEKKYDRLLSRLHENLISLLHKTRNNLTRYLIREFPQQLESLRNVIRMTVSSVADIHASFLPVKGVFFTSGRQGGICTDRVTLPISQFYQLTVSHRFPLASREQPYFIKGIIKTMTKNASSSETRFARYAEKHKKFSYLGYVVVGLFFLFMGFNYYTSLHHVKHSALALKKYQQLPQTDSFAELFPQLNYLATAKNSLNQLNTLFVPEKINQTRQWIDTQYQKTVSEQLLPQLAQKMEEILQNSRDPVVQYATLKAYLMLGKPQYFDITYLKSWLHEAFHLPSTGNKISLLLPFPSISLNTELIQQVQNNLRSIPMPYLAYRLFKNQTTQTVPFRNAVFTFSSSQKNIPKLYTRAAFEENYEKNIPAFARKMAQEVWILNNGSFSTPDNSASRSGNEFTQKELTALIRTAYLSDYAHWWQLFIYHLQPKPFYTLKEATHLSYLLIQHQAAAIKTLLAFICDNTTPFKNPTPAQQRYNQEIAAHFSDIPSYIATFPTLLPLLNDLHRFFSMVSQSNNSQTMIFDTLKQKFLNPTSRGTLNQLSQLAHITPNPLGQWLKQIVNHCWMLILSEAKSHINQQWQTQVITEYKHNIMARFPLNIAAQQEITLDDFNHFFNHRGTLAQFFQNYLSPFLNIEQAEWTTKKIDNVSLSISPEVIVELMRANVIREMFFPHFAPHPSVTFSLQALELQPIVSQMTLNINGQLLTSVQGSRSTQHFSWPGNYSYTPVTLSLQNITGERFQTIEYGPWGFFKLLYHANVQPVSHDSRLLQVVFDLNGNAAQYLLKTSNPVNPFVPDIIQAFQLPENL